MGLPIPGMYPSNSGQDAGQRYCLQISQIIITPFPFLLEILIKMLYNGWDMYFIPNRREIYEQMFFI